MAAKRPRVPSDSLPDEFETTMRELRKIVEGLESEDGGLEAAVAQFERGVKLQQHAQKQLEAARLRVEELLPEGGLAEFEIDDDEEER